MMWLYLQKTRKNYKKNLSIWDEELKKNGLTMNKTKTKVMRITRKKEERREQEEIKIDDTVIDWVESYDYLGTRIANDGKMNEEILNRINKASQVYYQLNQIIINKKELKNETKIQMYNSIYVPTLTYGLETSILEKKHKSKIQASEMKYLRQTLGKNKRDKVRNTKIRDDTKQQPLNDKIEQRQLA